MQSHDTQIHGIHFWDHLISDTVISSELINSFGDIAKNELLRYIHLWTWGLLIWWLIFAEVLSHKFNIYMLRGWLGVIKSICHQSFLPIQLCLTFIFRVPSQTFWRRMFYNHCWWLPALSPWLLRLCDPYWKLTTLWVVRFKCAVFVMLKHVHAFRIYFWIV